MQCMTRKALITWGLFSLGEGEGLKKFNNHLGTEICEVFPLLMFSQFFSLAKSTSSTNLQTRTSYHLSPSLTKKGNEHEKNYCKRSHI